MVKDRDDGWWRRLSCKANEGYRRIKSGTTKGGGYKFAEGMKAKDYRRIKSGMTEGGGDEVAEGINSFACQGTVVGVRQPLLDVLVPVDHLAQTRSLRQWPNNATFSTRSALTALCLLKTLKHSAHCSVIELNCAAIL